jgi:hypothetical protein
VNCSALHCLLKCSNIGCGVILFCLAETCKGKLSHSPIKLVTLDRPQVLTKFSLHKNQICFIGSGFLDDAVGV